jgi:hypothetical protein
MFVRYCVIVFLKTRYVRYISVVKVPARISALISYTVALDSEELGRDIELVNRHR